MPINVKNISFYIKNKIILEDISFDINCGEIITILGANGAGKSTLIKVISSEYKANKGEIIFDDIDAKNLSIKDIAKTRAVLPQDFNLSFPFTVSEVVMIGRSPHINGSETNLDYNIVDNVMKITDVYHLKERIYTTLSGGEQQRVQISRILAQIWSEDNLKDDNSLLSVSRNSNLQKTEISELNHRNKITSNKYVLLDEPTSNLDLKHQHLILKTFKALAKEKNIGVFAVLHDLNLAIQYSDKIILMKEGKIKHYGKPSEIINSENIKDVFDIDVKIVIFEDNNFPIIVPI